MDEELTLPVDILSRILSEKTIDGGKKYVVWPHPFLSIQCSIPLFSKCDVLVIIPVESLFLSSTKVQLKVTTKLLKY